MANIKAYSVSRTGVENEVANFATNASGVYSYSPQDEMVTEFGAAASAVPGAGRNGTYDYPTAQGLVVARTPTYVSNGRAATGQAAATDPFTGAITAGTANPDIPASTSVVATTTSLGTSEGAGLQVRFTTTAAGALPTSGAGNYVVVQRGDGYTNGDTVQIDGWPGSVATLTI
jgi:hypothetical protein